MKKYDVIVLGSGSASSKIISRSSNAGKSVAVVEDDKWGGTCNNEGCHPKKAFVTRSNAVLSAQMLEEKGIRGGVCKNVIDMDELQSEKKDILGSYKEDRKRAISNFEGVDIFEGRGNFVSRNEIEIQTVSGNTRIAGDIIVIATGAKPSEIPIEGREYMATSSDFLNLSKMEKDVTFVGGGIISCEFAPVAWAAGAKTRILEAMPRILGPYDSKLVELLTEGYREIGIDVITDAIVSKIESRGPSYSPTYLLHFKGDSMPPIRTDVVFHGGGRVPDVEYLVLDDGDVEYEKRGLSTIVKVDENLRSVSNQAVYVVGDANGIKPFQPVASMQGDYVADLILGASTMKIDYNSIPSVVFSFPTLVEIGEKGDDRLKETMIENFEDTSSWVSTRRLGTPRTGYRLVTDCDGKVLGFHLLGHNGDEIINVVRSGIREGWSVGKFAYELRSSTYPTSASDLYQMFARTDKILRNEKCPEYSLTTEDFLS